VQLTRADLRRRARQRLDDTVAPYLWSDQELNDAINDALIDASIRAHLTVEDDYDIAVTASTAKYALPSGVLDVKSVYLNSQPTVTLTRTSIRRREQYYGGRPNSTGTPWSYALDQTKAGTGDDYGILVRSITFIGTPTAADTAYLDIVRLPATLEVDTDIPEIDGMFHPDLVYGVLERAYMKSDIDSFDPVRSKMNAELFEARFGPRLPAVVLRERQTEVPYEMILG
jgi:hypothetical protein